MEVCKDFRKYTNINCDLPIISVGIDNYKQALEELYELIEKTDKFDCEAIKSPIDDYRQELEKLQLEQEQLKSDQDSLALRCMRLDCKIENNTEELNQNDQTIRNLQKQLGKIVRDEQKFEFKVMPLKSTTTVENTSSCT